MISSEPLHVVTFDLEVRKSVEAVGGWENVKKGEAGVSILVAHDSETDDYYFYDDHTLAEFAALVEQPGVVLVGYNSKEFDMRIVENLLQRTVPVKYHIDIYDLIRDALDHQRRTRRRGWKLGQVALRTMGITKTGNGEHAPDLAAAGRWAELITYCKHDVILTRQLLDYIRRHGGVLDNDGFMLTLDIPDWLRLPQRVTLEA